MQECRVNRSAIKKKGVVKEMGKTLKKLALISISVLFLTGCIEEQVPEFDTVSSNPVPITVVDTVSTGEPIEPPHELQTVGSIQEYNVVQDNKTGCMYLEYASGYQRGITPYYDGKGNVAGCNAPEGETVEEES